MTASVRRIDPQTTGRGMMAAVCRRRPRRVNIPFLDEQATMKSSQCIAGVVGLFLAISSLTAHAQEIAEPAELTADQTKFFETKIRPVLIRECYGCHSSQSGQAKGGLKLDTRHAMLVGGDSGAAIVPGDLDSSLFFGAITHTDFVMPPKRKLSDEQIADFRRWILDGAPDPRVTKAVTKPNTKIHEATIRDAKRTFWAYQPPRSHQSPVLAKSKDWASTEIDRFIEATLREKGLSPNADADAATVLRRLCFDLAGLPPSPEQLDWFAKAYESDAQAAVDRVIDSLLKSPRFGEHWGRHWLDVVRYAESTGREVNMTYPQAWRYRDYVIDSFNDDKPFDRFVQEQIAGDLLPVGNDEQWSKNLVATGFLAMGTKNVNEQSAQQFAADIADEQIDATTRVFLGTSVACARCHDHKFDPIRQQDYYALAGIFRSTATFFGNPPSQYGTFGGPQQRRNTSLILLPVADENPVGRSYTKSELDALHDDIESTMQQLSDLRRGGARNTNRPNVSNQQIRLRLQNELGSLSAKLSVVDDEGNPKSFCMGVQDAKQIGDTKFLVRGEIDQPAGRIQRDLPLALKHSEFEIPSGSSGRLELARWIGSDENTLTARVMTNRIWSHVFGQGLVRSTEDFGMTGATPSHPELLDTLAVQFVDSGWSVKAMVRTMARSRAYRMQSTFDQASHQADPDNQLLWRSNIKRLPAESIRDAMLKIADQIEMKRPLGSKVAEAGYQRVRSEQLGDPRENIRKAFERAVAQGRQQGFNPGANLQVGANRRTGPFSRGPSNAGRTMRGNQFRGAANSQQFRELVAKATQDASLDSPSDNHRSVYLPVVRDMVPRSLEVFDFADPSMIVGTREASNTANQALFMMNNPLTLRLSDSFADRLLDGAATTGKRVDLAFRLAYGRPPSDVERKASLRFLSESGLPPKQALSSFCQSLFAAAEFRYLN